MTGTIHTTTFRLLLLLTVAVLAAVGSKHEQASLETFPGLSTTRRSTDSTKFVTASTRKDEPGKPSSTAMSEAEAKNEKVSWGEIGEEEMEADGEEEDDDEGDEYEDELRGIAESHEAMSKDEGRNGISTSPAYFKLVSENQSAGNLPGGTKNFESHEKSTESLSDESSVSNEAIPSDEDEQVAELLKYKQKGSTTLVKEDDVAGGIGKTGSKAKRVPTVKKELSTQKEIIATNETEIFPKTLVSNVEIINRLDTDTKQERGYPGPVTAKDRNELAHGDISVDEEYADIDAPGDLLRKLDKRQPSVLHGLGSFALGGYASEQEQHRKLQELGIEESVLAESLLELLTRLAEDPRRWERIHRLLQDIKGDLELSRTSIADLKKRDYPQDSLLEIPIMESSTDSPEKSQTSKKPKKKKKKKKKPRHRLTSTSSTTSSTTISTTPTPMAFTPPLLTTTESTWGTTPGQWRLVAERLFGSPWSDDRQEVPTSSLAKVRYAAPAKQRGSVGSVVSQDRLLPIDEKQRESLKALNDERQALMLQSAREFSQPRRLHYGKVNTHEKGSPGSSHEDPSKSYDTGSAARVLDYDFPERSYHRAMNLDRYDHYGQYNRHRPDDYNGNPSNQQPSDEYDEVFRFPEGMTNRRPFARAQSFRPLGREYASTKSWQDSRFDYARPWKDKSRPSFEGIPGSNGNWPWRAPQSNYKIWLPRYEPWSRETSYPQRITELEQDLDDDEEYVDNESPVPRNWQRNPQQQTWRAFSGDWPIDRSDEGSPSWPVPERPKSYSREILPASLNKSKNRSDASNKESPGKTVVKEKPIVPKITMKTWNSLTSDPATWPFKLNGAKPWPKDKNGKSYNPNAELVRKLGLDKQDRLLSPTKDSDKSVGKESKKYENPAINGKPAKSLNVGKGSISWPDKLNAVNGWSNEKPREPERLPQRDEAREVWNGDVENDRKIWSSKSVPITGKISPVASWVMPADQSTWKPYETKHQAYGQLSHGPGDRWNDRTRTVDTGTESRSSWSPQKIDNDWNVRAAGFSGEKSSAPTSHASAWPSKWRQFAYHKVTAAPVTKAGGPANPSEGSGKPRNSYIAVSAVSAPKYPGNEWRKNDVETRPLDRSANDHAERFDQDDPSSQLRKKPTNSNDLWKQQRETSRNAVGKDRERNSNDPLEHELEELRHVPYWKQQQLRAQIQKRSNASGVSTSTTTVAASTESPSPRTNSTTIRDEKSEKKLEGISPVVDSQVQQKKNVTK